MASTAIVGFVSLDFTLVVRPGNLGLGTYSGWALQGDASGDSITPGQLNGEDIFVLATLGGGSAFAGSLQFQVRNIQAQDFFRGLTMEIGTLAGIEFLTKDADTFNAGALTSWYWTAAALNSVATPVVITV